MDPATDLGPLQNRKQYERVIGFLDDIRATGGEFVAGGSGRPLADDASA